MNILDRLNEEVSIYALFDRADPPVKYKTDKKPCQISCPFHGKDTRPSARVYPDTNSFSCFFCSKSWGPVAFWAEANNWYTKRDKLDLGRAIDDLCRLYNITDQTFDWQRKFYQIKVSAETKGTPTIDERRALSDYYSWSVSKIIHAMSPELRDKLSDSVLSLWVSYDLVNLSDDTWEQDLKNWYEHAKIVVGGEV